MFYSYGQRLVLKKRMLEIKICELTEISTRKIFKIFTNRYWDMYILLFIMYYVEVSLQISLDFSTKNIFDWCSQVRLLGFFNLKKIEVYEPDGIIWIGQLGKFFLHKKFWVKTTEIKKKWVFRTLNRRKHGIFHKNLKIENQIDVKVIILPKKKLKWKMFSKVKESKCSWILSKSSDSDFNIYGNKEFPTNVQSKSKGNISVLHKRIFFGTENTIKVKTSKKKK